MAAADGTTAIATGTVTGTVTVNGDGEFPIVYVYVDDVEDPAGTKRPTEVIEQKHLVFNPKLKVVPVGTKITFPNNDSEPHSVFSPSPNYMDLGRFSKNKSKFQVFRDVGEVDIYCDIHKDMAAKVMVMPSSRFVQVAGDGTYSIDVPADKKHRLAVWTPNQASSYVKRVRVEAGGTTELNFKITRGAAPSTHMNKAGKPYDYRP